MKIAIHHRKGSFSDRWIDYCENNNFEYKVVNAFDSNIIQQLSDCNAFMWHHHHNEFRDALTAKRILFSLEHAGIKVFPDFKTGWHFDDKVAQKYLLEAIGAPLVPSYVFYDKKNALSWIRNTTYPKVFKLKGGAGASNVQLIQTEDDAKKLVIKAFGKGFLQFDRVEALKERLRKYKEGKTSIVGVLKGFGRMFLKPEFAKQQARERGYVYFQDFIPDNDSDIRVIIVDNKAFAIKRKVRENDFRASGSGSFIYDKSKINFASVKLSFELNKKIKATSIAFDFVLDSDNNPKVVEVSYGFKTEVYDPCPGYWNSNLEWCEGEFNPQEWMIHSILGTLK